MELTIIEMLNIALFSNKICIFEKLSLYLPYLFDFEVTKSFFRGWQHPAPTSFFTKNLEE